MLGGEFFYADAADARGDRDDALGGAVEHERQVEFAPDLGAGLDINLLDDLALRARLHRHQARADHLVRDFLHFVLARAQLDAAGLAARAGMNLRLDDAGRRADLTVAGDRLRRAVGELAGGDLDAVSLQDFFRLIFVDVHGFLRVLFLRRRAQAR